MALQEISFPQFCSASFFYYFYYVIMSAMGLDIIIIRSCEWLQGEHKKKTGLGKKS